MLKTRVIPVLLFQAKGLVKTKNFKDPRYIGDPINIIKIFNEKEVDELILLDIESSKLEREPNYKLLEDIASECFMPVCYGGGIKTINQMRTLFALGIEKISLNFSALTTPELISESVEVFGSQSIVLSVDIKKTLLGNYKIYNYVNKKTLNVPYLEHIKTMEELGVGEILINNVDLDGTKKGYDTRLLKSIVETVNLPVIACGGAGKLTHLKEVRIESNVRAVGAGSFFIYQGKHDAVLITYPGYQELSNLFGDDL